MHPKDDEYFTNFYAEAKTKGLNLQDYYLTAQRSFRNEMGGAFHLEAHELRGISFSLKYVSPQDNILIMGE